MITMLDSKEVKTATIEELAKSILDNSDGRPASDSFMRIAAIELAKRIIGGDEQEIKCAMHNKGTARSQFS